MKLTLQIKLLPTAEQKQALIATLREANKACNRISDTAWRNKTFNQFRLHHLVYQQVKLTTKLSAQIVIRCISKVADSYKINKSRQHSFKPLGAITYDERILSYKPGAVSIWSTIGRLKVPFLCHNIKYLPYIKGEADLIYKNEKFYLFQTVEVPEEIVKNVEEFIGVDFGVINIATLSDGTNYSSKRLNKVRDKYFRTRRSIQGKGTYGAKKLLKRLGGRERRFATIINHTISKQIIKKAKKLGVGVAIEDLTGIRSRTTVRKKQRRRHSNWAFHQLRSFLDYKAKLAGVPLAVVSPKYTSQTCNACGVIGKRDGQKFSCPSCGYKSNADLNAAKNIAQLGAAYKPARKEQKVSS